MLLLTAVRSLQLFVVDDFFGPAATGGLTIGIDQRVVGRLVGQVIILDTDLFDQQVLRHLGRGNGQADGNHLLEVDFTCATGQHETLAF
ncbi:hypothetical protein D3C76_1286200 [compost metagenome]